MGYAALVRMQNVLAIEAVHLVRLQMVTQQK